MDRKWRKLLKVNFACNAKFFELIFSETICHAAIGNAPGILTHNIILLNVNKNDFISDS